VSKQWRLKDYILKVVLSYWFLADNADVRRLLLLLIVFLKITAYVGNSAADFGNSERTVIREAIAGQLEVGELP
jgi:hypothetical protein